MNSKADEMFEKLGYEKETTQLSDIRYYKNDDNVIHFDYARYGKPNGICKSGAYDGMCDDITTQELQAINEKVKELGWIK